MNNDWSTRNGWTETTLGEGASNIAYGFTESATLEKIGPKFLRITDIQNDFIDWNSVPYCPISEREHKKYKLEIGDVVIARTGNSTGATSTIKQADFRFIDFLLRSAFWKGFVKSIKGGSAQGGANAKNFAEFPILLPSLPEQKAIADVLTSFDDKIELLRQQNQTLEEMAQTLFKEWFVYYRFPGVGKMVDSELGMIPEGWKVDGIRSLVKHVKISITPLNNPKVEFHHFSIPAYDNFQIPEFVLGKSILSNKYKVVEHCILVSKLNPISPRNWMVLKPHENSVCSTEFQVIKPLNKEHLPYIFSLFSSSLFIQILASKAQGTSSSHQRVSPQDILDTSVVIPNAKILLSYNERVFPMLSKIDSNKNEIQTLTQIKDRLLPKLMSGEVRVKQ